MSAIPVYEVPKTHILPILLRYSLFMIIPVITTTLKYPHAVGEARMLQPPHDDAFPGVEPSRSGIEAAGVSHPSVG